MYKIVLKVPEIVFLIFIFLPVFLIIGDYFPDAFTGMILSFIGLLTGIFWMLGVSDYFEKSAGNSKTDWILIIMILFFLIAACRDIYQNFMDHPSFYNTQFRMPIFSLVTGIIVATLFTIKIKKTFPARSIWFIFIEVLFYGIGVATLTPEIKNHYRENRKKMDKIFAGENDEELLN